MLQEGTASVPACRSLISIHAIEGQHLGKRELFTGCKVVQERGRARGQPHGARLVAGIMPGRTNHRVQLLPLRRIQALVAPLLELLVVGVSSGAVSRNFDRTQRCTTAISASAIW